MKSLLILVSLLALAFASDVIELTHENFDTVISENPLLLVEFYAPWCGHCKHLAPEYEVAATQLKEVGIPIAKLDADNEAHRDIAAKHDIRGYPTLKVFRNGAVQSDYQGERTSAGIVSFMKKQALPAVSKLTTLEETKTFSTVDKVVVIGFFDSEDSQEYKDFQTVADKFRNDYVFGAVIGASNVNKEFEVEKTPSVILFKKFDEGKNVLTSDKISELESFVSINSIPTVDEIGPSNYQKFVDSGLPLGYLFVDPSKEGQTSEYVERLRDTAKSTKGKINWVWIDWKKYAKHAERLGLSGKVVPCMSIDNMQTGKHYALDETKDPTKELIQSWVQDYLDGKLIPTVRSEEIPADNNGPVKVVVAKNFDDIVLDETKDVMLEFYAPWCGHCKHLAPVYEEVGKELEGEKGIVVAKIDATANDVDPKYGIKGFPTLKFFPADKTKKDQPIEYNGDRTKEAILAFIRENAMNKPSGKDEL